MLRALLVTKDDQAVATLAPVLEHFGLAMHCSGYGDAVCLVSEQRFHAVLVDFEDPHSAALVLDSLAASPFEVHPVTVALLADRLKVRKVLGAGAHFIIYKPVVREQAQGTLRAASSLIQQDRRASFRVPIQVPLRLTLNSGADPLEGLLLDLSADGADLLSPQPLYPSARVGVGFTLPEFPFELHLRGEVQWANPNGETGVRFTGTPEKVGSALRRWLEDRHRKAGGEQLTAIQNCKLTDLSLGACYIETPSPFPERTHVTLRLRAQRSELQAHGIVRVMHPSHGMGIEFPTTAKARRETESFILFLGSQPGLQPELRVSPRPAELVVESEFQTARGFEDPLLELLHNHEALPEEKFLEALESQRRTQSAPSR
jgi:hypothetical protein